MSMLQSFVKAAPVGFRPCARPGGECYKYFVCGKGCVLGVLFEDSMNVYFEWLTEDGLTVDYAPEIRYKAWSKRAFERLLVAGVWEVTEEGPRSLTADGLTA